MPGQFFLEIFSCVGSFRICDVLRSAFCDNFPSLVPAVGTEIDDPVCCFYHIEVMFDNHNGVSFVH